jgi:hypothetical protein
VSEKHEKYQDIELPHEAWYDDESNMVCISLDRCTFSFTPVEFFTFASQVDDVATVLGQMTTVKDVECPTCGIQLSGVSVQAIPDKDYN